MMLRLPRGYRRLARTPLAVAHEDIADTVTAILATTTLHAWAAAHPERREYRGRGPVYSAPLPGTALRVVVRHAWRGGLMAPLLRDLWLAPTPAPAELLIASILAHEGVPTPPVLGFATYRVMGWLRRADVMTLELPGTDLPAALATAESPAARTRIVEAVADLLAALLDAGVWHQDLNAKNILITPDGSGTPRAAILDVDRVRFVPAGDPSMAAANLGRLRRSMDKLRAAGVASLTGDEFATIENRIRTTEATRAEARIRQLQTQAP